MVQTVEATRWQSETMLIATQPTLQILLVDDDLLSQQVATFMIKRLGHSIDKASNGRQALAKLHTFQYDIVLLDMYMPDLDGVEVALQICRVWPNITKRPYIIALTASVTSGERERCLAGGIDDYISKPLQYNNLQSLLEKAVALRRLRMAAPAFLSAIQIAPAEPQEDTESEAILDLGVLHNLRGDLRGDSGDGSAIWVKLTNSYSQATTKLVADIKHAATQGEVKVLLLAAHSLYNSNATFGAMRAARLCREVEALARTALVNGSGLPPIITGMLELLELACTTARTTLQFEISKLS